MPSWLTEYLMPILMPQFGLTEQSQWPNCCNANFYETPADQTGFHTDDEPLFGLLHNPGLILSVSFGVEREMLFRPYFGPGQSTATSHHIKLAAGDLVAMEIWTQKHFHHAVYPPISSLTTAHKRFNLTFRYLNFHHIQCPCFHGDNAFSLPRMPIQNPDPSAAITFKLAIGDQTRRPAQGKLPPATPKRTHPHDSTPNDDPITDFDNDRPMDESENH